MAAEDVQKQFDVFISYSHKNAEWVRDVLVARLKQEGITVCIDEESFDIGVPALVNMENAIAASRRTLLVLTPAWVASDWTRFESLLIQHTDPGGVLQCTLPLLLEQCDVPQRIGILTRADFTGKADVEREFAKLFDAIRGKRRLSGPETKNSVEEEKTKAGYARVNSAVPRPPAVGFVERHHKDGSEIVARLEDELAPAKNQLVVLWGDGGVGKTTIAAEAMRRMNRLFAGRIVWTSAVGRQDYSLSTLLDEVATQLDHAELRKLALAPKKEEVPALIASLDGAAMIVLDNFETIAPAEQKLCAEWLMQHAPCPALITTRERINGPRNLSIDVMSSAEAHEYLDKLIAQTANPQTFAGIDHSRIIQAADANPLVMQWVIGQIELAQHPNDVFDELAQGGGDAADRVFDRSFNLPQLGDDGRDVLLTLSLFVPSASRAALAEAAGFGDDLKRVREAIRHLARLRLVETTEAGERLVLRGLTRSLARARLSKDSRADEFRRRYITYFVGYAKSHAKTSKEDFDALEAERENALGALESAFELAEWEAVMQIRIALEEFLDTRGYWNEAIGYGQQALAAARRAKNDGRIGMFSHNIGRIYSNRGEYDQARRLYNESMEIKKRLGNQRGIAITLHQLGRLAEQQGEIEEARQLYNDSLEIAKRLGNQSGIAITLHQLAMLAQEQGEIEEARRLYNDSLEIKRRLGNQRGIALTTWGLANLALGAGYLDEARKSYKEALDIFDELGDQYNTAGVLHQLGRLAEIEGKYTEASRLFHEALDIFEKLKSPNAAITRRSLERIQGKA
ncbi:MAG TPA: tetratricopeptide repeat protein [Blastocatellia bacterium]|nr:tetratricopeptide repeat protein [Blastocatellia bacterium]